MIRVSAVLAFQETEHSKIFPNAAFGYRKVTVERSLQIRGIDPERAYAPKEIKALRASGEVDEHAPVAIKKIHRPGKVEPAPLRGFFEAAVDGKPGAVEYEPDPELRDTEQVPLLEQGGIEAFLHREVLPHAPDAWYGAGSVKTGYEISFTRYFYKPQPLRRATIRELCGWRALSVEDWAALVRRNPDYLETRYLKAMIRAGELQYTIPDLPRHSNQVHRVPKTPLTEIIGASR